MQTNAPGKPSSLISILHKVLQLPLWLRVLLALLVLAGFSVYFDQSHASMNDSTFTVAMLVVAFTGLLLGPGGGITGALLITGLELAALTRIQETNLLRIVDPTILTNLLALLISGIVVGLLRSMTLQSLRELEERRKNEAALRDSAGRFRTMADLTYNWESWQAPDGSLIYSSPSVQRITGYTAEMLSEKSSLLWDLTIPEDRPALAAHYAVATGQDPIHQVDIRIRHAEGHIIWLRHICQPVYDSHGAFQGRRASNLDITEIQQANEELKRRLDLEVLLSRISNHLIDVPPDEFNHSVQQTLERVAAYAEADRVFLFSFKPGSLVIDELFQWSVDNHELVSIYAGLDVENFPWINAHVREGEVMHLPTLADLPAEAAAERDQWKITDTISVLAIPLVSEGSPIGVLGISANSAMQNWQEKDIRSLQLVAEIYGNLLERRRIQSELVNSENRFRSTFENAGFGIALVNKHSVMMDVNSLFCEMFGYTREELIGRATDEITHPDDRRQDYAMVLELLESREASAQRELRYLRKTGEMFWGRLTISLVWGPTAGDVYGIGMLEDITEQRRIAAELHSRERILEAVGFAAEDMLRMPDWEKGLERALQALGSATQVNGVSIYQVENETDELFMMRPVSYWADDPQRGRILNDPEASMRVEKSNPVIQALLESHIFNGSGAKLSPGMSRMFTQLDIAEMLVVPIYVDNKVWGFISFFSATEGGWSTAEEEGLKIAADVFGAAFQRRQVEKQIEQLYRAEHDQRQLAEALRDTAETLNASLNLQEVFEQVLLNLEKVVPNDAANIMLIDNGVTHVVGARGYSERGKQENILNVRYRIEDFPNFEFMFNEGQPVVNSVVGESPAWVNDPGFGWIRSFAGAPIRQDGHTIGFLNVDSVTPNLFNQAHANRLQVFADQAALAIRNARLLEEARRRAQQIALLNQMAQAAISASTQAEMLDHMVNSLAALFDSDSVAILLFDRAGGYPSVGAIVGEATGLKGQISGAELSGFMLIEQPMQIEDLSTRPDAKSASALLHPCRALLALPMVLEEQRLGVVLVGFKETRHITPAEVTLGEQATLHVALGISKNQLLEAERMRTRQLARANDLFAALDHVATRIGAAADSSGVIKTLETELQQLDLSYAVALLDSATGEMHLQYYSFRTHSEWRNRHNEIIYLFDDDNFKHSVMNEQVAYFVPDPMRMVYNMNREINPETIHDLVRLAGFNDQTHMFLLPLIVKERAIGLLAVWGGLEESDRTVMGTFASQLAVAFYNASLYEEIQRVAITDEMTGLFNRRGMHEFGEREVERARRFDRPLSALMIDLDLFSRVNNTYGHLVGDEVLRRLAERIRANIRELDVAVRFGGEEFLILLVETDQQAALVVAERIRAAIAGSAFETSAGLLRITASIGVAQMDAGMAGITHLIAHADQALYVAKQTGRNRVAAG